VDKKPRRRRTAIRDIRDVNPSNPPAPGDAAFDDWLETRLRTAYSSVLDEPIPEDLMRLLNQKFKD
jgi:hypothetical protein